MDLEQELASKVGGRLRAWRERHGLSAPQVAARAAELGYTTTGGTLTTWERGERCPPLPALIVLAQVYGTDPQTFLVEYAREDVLIDDLSKVVLQAGVISGALLESVRRAGQLHVVVHELNALLGQLRGVRGLLGDTDTA